MYTSAILRALQYKGVHGASSAFRAITGIIPQYYAPKGKITQSSRYKFCYHCNANADSFVATCEKSQCIVNFNSKTATERLHYFRTLYPDALLLTYLDFKETAYGQPHTGQARSDNS